MQAGKLQVQVQHEICTVPTAVIGKHDQKVHY